MLRIAGQTAGPNGLKSGVETHRWPPWYIIFQNTFFNEFFFSGATPGPSVSNK